MVTQAQVFQLLRDFLNDPDDPVLRRKTLRYLAHSAFRELKEQKEVLDSGFTDDRDTCPRCWGTLFNDIGSDTPCSRCQEGGVAVGTIPKP